MRPMASSCQAVLVAAAAALTLLLASAPHTEAHNITKILAGHPEFSEFNKYLTETRLAFDINRRLTITVLAVDNAGMASLISRHLSLPTIRHILSLHVLVDYYGSKKLHGLSHGSTASASMFQSTGAAPGTTGYVNITEHRGGHVTFFAEDATDTDSPATYVKSIKEIPYNISVIEISSVLSSPEADAPVPPPPPVNLTELMSKKYCKAFADLLIATGVEKTLDDNVAAGLTLFCPIDAAVTAFAPKFKNLTKKAQSDILLYHATPNYFSMQQLKSNNGILTSLTTASVVKHDYSYDVQNDGDTVTLETGVNTPSIVATVDDEEPLAVYAINKFLKPKELFKVPAAPAPEGSKKGKKKGAAPSPDDADAPGYASSDKAADAAYASRLAAGGAQLAVAAAALVATAAAWMI